MEEEIKVDEIVLPSDDKVEEVVTPTEAEVKPEVKEEPKVETKEVEEKVEDKSEVKEEVEVKDVEPEEFNKYGEMLMKDGDIPEDIRDEIAKKWKLPKDVVDNYVEMAKKTRETQVREALGQLHSVVGGEEEYKGMIEWAKANLDKEAKETFDKQLDSGMQNAKMAVEWLYGKYKNAGQATIRIEGKPRPQVQGYKSKADYIKDLSDRRYASDKAYRDKVNAKLNATNIDLF